MSVDVVSLEPVVHAILTAPGVDLSTISAKRVRKQLSAQNPDLTDDWIRDNKAAIDALTAKVFTQLQPLTQEEQSEAGPSESHQSPGDTEDGDVGQDDEEVMEEEEEEEKKRPAKKPKKNKPLTDEEYAKQLSSEINGRTRSSRSGTSAPRRSRGGKPKGSRRNVSAATVDSDNDGDEEVGKKRKKSSGGGGGARGGFSKEYVLSEPLAVVIQVERLSRPQVVKKLWEYIKGNDLQNPSNKREILCDSSLRAVFGQDKIDMFKMNKILGHHLTEP